MSSESSLYLYHKVQYLTVNTHYRFVLWSLLASIHLIDLPPPQPVTHVSYFFLTVDLMEVMDFQEEDLAVSR